MMRSASLDGVEVALIETDSERLHARTYRRAARRPQSDFDAHAGRTAERRNCRCHRLVLAGNRGAGLRLSGVRTLNGLPTTFPATTGVKQQCLEVFWRLRAVNPPADLSQFRPSLGITDRRTTQLTENKNKIHAHQGYRKGARGQTRWRWHNGD